MAAGWKNPNAPYDFTEGEWRDYKKNYSNLSWGEYKQMKKWDVEERMENKKYSFTEAYKKANDIDPQHYHFDIEPFDYIHDNQMNFAEGNVIKYITRWRYKDGIKDLYKAKQYIDMLIAKEITDGESRT